MLTLRKSLTNWAGRSPWAVPGGNSLHSVATAPHTFSLATSWGSSPGQTGGGEKLSELIYVLEEDRSGKGQGLVMEKARLLEWEERRKAK